MTADGAALLRAVLADPRADLPRLIYADWLDDYGEPERADLIRVHCELARHPARHPRRGGCRCARCRLTRRLAAAGAGVETGYGVVPVRVRGRPAVVASVWFVFVVQ